MHIVANIRNLDKFLNLFPWAAEDPSPGEDFKVPRRGVSNTLRAQQFDLVVAQVSSVGATTTESRDGKERSLTMGEWIIAPLVGRESSLSHSSVLPTDGISVGSTIDYICRGGGLGLSMDNPPGQGDPTRVCVRGVLQYDDGRVARCLDFAVETRHAAAAAVEDENENDEDDDDICPVIAVIGSCSDCGKTTACLEVVRYLHQKGRSIGVVKLSGTARLGELLNMATHANQRRDMADAGLPTTYPPSQDDDEKARLTAEQSLMAAERNLRDLSIDNDIIVAELGGDLLSACVPEILAEPARLGIVALVMAAESATAVIGMETKLGKIADAYRDMPRYVVGPCTNLLANRNRVERETDCAGCYDLWTQHTETASPAQIQTSKAHAEELTQRLLELCGY
ncbi:hypothetical protein ED733_002200 [Metarhizium rileyi]|uniref:CobQ/CobB/MinD/ParA nucleotide binding domain-containing protein n=1 Tax=Metarhizium rileyi (strain RCEF 4871) TaxID=1649241 RepID=A0A5C6GLY2_METRR|nr:hypothetical protein ED733_002200 [Metarhizium rileyi]